jgi:hypothetical protein
MHLILLCTAVVVVGSSTYILVCCRGGEVQRPFHTVSLLVTLLQVSLSYTLLRTGEPTVHCKVKMGVDVPCALCAIDSKIFIVNPGLTWVPFSPRHKSLCQSCVRQIDWLSIWLPSVLGWYVAPTLFVSYLASLLVCLTL